MWHNLWIWGVLRSIQPRARLFSLRRQQRPTSCRHPRRISRQPASGSFHAVGVKLPKIACPPTVPTETSTRWPERPDSIGRLGARVASTTKCDEPRASTHHRRPRRATTTNHALASALRIPARVRPTRRQARDCGSSASGHGLRPGGRPSPAQPQDRDALPGSLG